MPNNVATLLIVGLVSAAIVSSCVPLCHAQVTPPTNLVRSTGPALYSASSAPTEFDQRVNALSRSFHLEPLEGIHESPVVTAMAISSDDDLLIAAGDDHAVRVVKLDSLETVATLEGHLDWVQSVQISRNGDFIVSVGNDRDVWIWHRDRTSSSDQWQGKPIFHADNALYSVAIHPGDSKISFGGFGPKIWTIDLNTMAAEQRVSIDDGVASGALSVHQCKCKDQRVLKVTSDARKIVCAGRDGVLRVWDLAAAEHLHEIELHNSRIRSMTLSSDDSTVSTVGEDRRLVRYDIEKREIISQKRIPGGKLFSMCQPTGGTLALGSTDNSLRIFSIDTNRVAGTLTGHDGTVDVMCSGKKYIVTGSHDTSIRVWQLEKTLEYITTSAGNTAAAENHSNAFEQRVR